MSALENGSAEDVALELFNTPEGASRSLPALSPPAGARAGPLQPRARNVVPHPLRGLRRHAARPSLRQELPRSDGVEVRWGLARAPVARPRRAHDAQSGRRRALAAAPPGGQELQPAEHRRPARRDHTLRERGARPARGGRQRRSPVDVGLSHAGAGDRGAPGCAHGGSRAVPGPGARPDRRSSRCR